MTAREPLTWVLGRGGLLGAHLCGQLARSGTAAWTCPTPPFAWNSLATVRQQFQAAIHSFCSTIRAHQCPWRVLWAAGRSVVASSEEGLDCERAVWSEFLDQLGKELTALGLTCPGSVFFASSAGGVYAGATDRLITEATLCAPLAPYGRSKLRQEEELRQWAAAHPATRFLIGRIANLFGPGQSLAKSQGVISHLSRSVIHGRPLHIFVPLDTVRDYVYAAECARSILACSRRLEASSMTGITKIFASERGTTLAQLIGAIARHSPRRPRLVFGSTPVSRLQPRQLLFRSQVWPDLNPRWVSIEEGIGVIHRHNLRLFCQGQLAIAG